MKVSAIMVGLPLKQASQIQDAQCQLFLVMFVTKLMSDKHESCIAGVCTDFCVFFSGFPFQREGTFTPILGDGNLI